MAAPIEIRPYDHLRDARNFTALNYATFRDSIPREEFVTEAEFKRHYQWLMRQFQPHNPRRNTILVAEVDEVYAGHCWVGSQTDFFTRRVDPWIFDLSVVEKFRQIGVARRLHEAAIQQMQEQGHRMVGLQVMAHNEGAAAMYRSFGYRPRAISLKKKLS